MIPTDKILHAQTGALIGIICTHKFGNPFAGIFIAAIAGAIKELWDEYQHKKGNHSQGFDVYDLMWTIAGGIAGSIYEGFK